jgi:hypothetical protein
LRSITTGLKRDTLIKHKEAVVICEKNGHISLSYNALLITLEVNIIVKPILPVVTVKSSLIYANCGKACHTLETYHNKKKKVLVILTTIVKSIDTIIKIKPVKIHVCYPYRIFVLVQSIDLENVLGRLKYKTCLELNLLILMLLLTSFFLFSLNFQLLNFPAIGFLNSNRYINFKSSKSIYNS